MNIKEDVNSLIINNLKKKLFELKKDYVDLTTNKSEIFKKYYNSILLSQKNKKINLENWKINEIEFAKKNSNGFIYSAQCEFENEIEENKEKEATLIYLKADKICNEFKDTYLYFKEQGYEFPFDEIMKKTSEKELPDFNIVDTDFQLISKDIIKKEIDNFNEIDINFFETNFKNNIFIQIGSLPKLEGKIVEKNDIYFEFQTLDGQILHFSWNHVKFGNLQIFEQ